VVSALLFLALLCLLSVIFEDTFASEGVTPASILLGVLLITVAASCGKDPVHPARILATLLMLGFVVGPIVHAVTGIYALPDGAERQRALLGRATWLVLAGAVLSFLAMRAALGNAWRADLHQAKHQRLSRGTLLGGIAVAGIGLAALVGYLILSGIGSVSLQGRGATYAVVPHEGREAYLGLLAPISLGGLLVIAARALERPSRRLFVLSTAAAIGVGTLLALPGSRANLLYAIAPVFFLFVAYRRFPKWRWVVVAITLLIVVLSYGASFRTADTRSALVHDPWRMLSESAPEPTRLERLFLVDGAHTEPLLGTMDAYPATSPFLGGESAALGFTGPAGWKFAKIVGLRIDPPAGVTFTAVAYGQDPSTFDGGLTATLPGELYANAGVPGVLVGLAAFGAVLGVIRRRTVLSGKAGRLVLYAAAVTVLFAMFADYFGQFYRGGAILVGVVIALAAGRQNPIAFRHLLLAGVIIGASAVILLLTRRLAGAPPTGMLTSFGPVYGILSLLLIATGVSAGYWYRNHRTPANRIRPGSTSAR
jgi:hypothetical protein